MNTASLTTTSTHAVNRAQTTAQQDAASQPKDATRQAFQDFVAGTFYRQMLKAMRSTQQSVQYLDGGQAEQAFRSQLDQQIAEDLARDHGAAFSDELYKTFRTKLDARSANVGARIDYLA